MLASDVARQMEERESGAAALSIDNKFKKYIQQVEKCLATFENVHEWADFIAFLTKLLKTLQLHNQYKEVPHKLIVSKRLAQCLNPALPTGVHQRALDVYSHILAVIGPDGLKRDLRIWSPGLFPFFEYAATSVKPTLLTIYSTHYLSLRSGLRPIMKSLILALLPGLEEETGEFFDRVMAILDELSVSITPTFFLQNLWLVLLTAPMARTAVLNFLSRRFSKLNQEVGAEPVIGNDIGLMIRAFGASLEDDNILVRRGILELLVQSFRLDSPVFNGEDYMGNKALLMRAALGVVLRRDLSLNRRLFNWLLGPDEHSEVQVKFFREHGLKLLTTTLKDDMLPDSTSMTDSRPFKIFISLLDKWEIGSLLTEALLLDAFRAIRYTLKCFSGSKNESGAADILMIANTLYEAVEPFSLWKQLFVSTVEGIIDKRLPEDSIRITIYILESFSIHEEEVLRIHLPILLVATSEIIANIISRDITKLNTSEAIKDGLELLRVLVRHIPSNVLSRPLQLPNVTDGTTAPLSSYAMGIAFYGVEKEDLDLIRSSTRHDTDPPSPFVLCLKDLVVLAEVCAQNAALSDMDLIVQDFFASTAGLTATLVSKLEERLKEELNVQWWSPRHWTDLAMRILDELPPFDVLHKVSNAIITLSQSRFLRPQLIIDEQSLLEKMTFNLLHFLRPQYVPYHVSTVQLIWALERSTSSRRVESIIASSLAVKEGQLSIEAYEAFGVFWRFTDDSLIPGNKFRQPLLLVLDTLRSDNATVRRVGETWMRCSLKSYLRAVDPILFDLVDPSIRRSETTNTYQGKDIKGYIYDRPVDLVVLHHLLENLQSIARFGGQGFGRVIKTALIERSLHPGLVARIQGGIDLQPSSSYADVIVDLLLKFVQTEPHPDAEALVIPNNVQLQACSLDILQVLTAQGDMQPALLDIIGGVVISKLFSSIHTNRLDLQPKLLHVLHSVMMTSSATTGPSLSVMGISGNGQFDVTPMGSEGFHQHLQLPASNSIHSLLVRTLVNGISTPPNRPVLQHWVDFILMIVPLLQQNSAQTIHQLTEAICRQLRMTVEELSKVTGNGRIHRNVNSFVTDSELIALLNALEKVALLGVMKSELDTKQEEDLLPSEKTVGESGGLLGLVSNVFVVDSSSAQEDYITPLTPGYRCLHEAVQVLVLVWLISTSVIVEEAMVIAESLSLICNRVKTRCRKVLEHLFRSHPVEVLESVIECWNSDASMTPNCDQKAGGSFEIIDTLTSSAQTAVHLICESISHRIFYSERGKKTLVNSRLSENTLFGFLEGYLARLEGPIASQVWGRYLALTKEVTTNVQSYKHHVFPILRCLTVLSEKVIQTSATEDRRLRRDLQDNFVKLVDACILISGKSFESGNWIRRTARDSLIETRSSTPVPRVQPEGPIADRAEGLTVTLGDDTSKRNPSLELTDQINVYLASRIIMNMRRFITETDKIVVLCNNMIYYIVNPAMKSKTRMIEIDSGILDLLIEMARIPVAAKAWKTPLLELFNDNRFFNSPPEMTFKWSPLIRSLTEVDKQVVAELLGKLASTNTANIFTNREYEMLLRSLNLRRLSFIIYSGNKDQFLAQLPAIQERLVDILRTSNIAPIVVSEVYLCLRVLLFRLSSRNMLSFWPVILTEMIRIFNNVRIAPPADGSDDLVVVLSVCKFLDLILVLQTEDFQVHQWIFVTDTVDAVYRPDDWFPESIMDQLAEIIGDKRPPEDNHDPQLPWASTGLLERKPQTTSGDARSGIDQAYCLRRPLLATLRSINSLKDLTPFFSLISMTSYESIYRSSLKGLGTSSGSGSNRGADGIDWGAVDKMLIEEMFEGH